MPAAGSAGERSPPFSGDSRISDVATSIRLENLFWQVLEEIGARDGLSVAQLISRLYDELTEAGGQGVNDSANFTSFLRVSCGRYLALQVSGRIPADNGVPIRSLDADWVLAGERPAHPCTCSARRQLMGMTRASILDNLS